MPKFRIICATSTNYYVTVDAPDITAVKGWYSKSDGSEFEGGEESCWKVVDMYQLPGHDVMTATVKINEDGIGEVVAYDESENSTEE